MRRAAAVSNVERAGGIGGDEFHIHPLPRTEVETAVASARRDDGLEQAGQLRPAPARN